MVLIADAGSTKTRWIMVNNEHMVIGKFESAGLNPTVFNEETLLKNIATNNELLNHAPYINNIYFYGSGVDNSKAFNKMENVLKNLFDKAEIKICSDMLAAARATSGTEEGIISILGTGSNSCYYDGKEIIKSIGYFGYILMDDASGNWFGKQLLRDYIFGKMPKQLKQQFKIEYNFDEKKIIKELYEKQQPNTYLATFALFMNKHYKSPYIKELLTRGFEKFVTQELSAYKNYKKLPLHFSGSIAYYYKKELISVLNKHNLIVGKIIMDPTEELINFHI